MSDLYTKESKSQTLSRTVPMWFNPARQSPASLPELALKWHCTVHAAGAYSPELERPTCRAEGPCPPSPTATPSFTRSQGERGCGGAGERGLKGHPQLMAGACGWRFLLRALLIVSASYRGTNTPWLSCHPCQHPSKGMASVSSATGASLAPLRTCKRVAIVLGRTGIELPSLPPPHPCMTWPCTTKAFLHHISDNSQSCEMSEQYGKAGNGGGWERAPMVGQAKREGGAQKCQT